MTIILPLGDTTTALKWDVGRVKISDVGQLFTSVLCCIVETNAESTAFHSTYIPL